MPSEIPHPDGADRAQNLQRHYQRLCELSGEEGCYAFLDAWGETWLRRAAYAESLLAQHNADSTLSPNLRLLADTIRRLFPQEIAVHDLNTEHNIVKVTLILLECLWRMEQ